MGGVYLDTDAQILKDISSLLENEAFLAFEHNEMVNTGVCGSASGNQLLKEMLEYYNTLRFFNKDGKMVTTVTGEYLTKVFMKHGLELNGKEQTVENWKIYPFTYFYPVKVINDNTYYSDNTCICHWFEGTWVSDENAKARAHDLNPIIRRIRKMKIMKLYYNIRNGRRQ